MSVLVGFSDHNIVALTVKAKVPKAGPKVIHRRTYRNFLEKDFIFEIESIEWDAALEKMHVNAALDCFMNLFSTVCDKHAPIKKFTVRSVKAPWLDEELRNMMRDRDLLKKSAILSGGVASLSLIKK